MEKPLERLVLECGKCGKTRTFKWYSETTKDGESAYYYRCIICQEPRLITFTESQYIQAPNEKWMKK